MNRVPDITWLECWQELRRLRRDMHRLFERMRSLAPNNSAVNINTKRVASLAIECAGEVCSVNLHQLRNRCRKNEVAWARHIAIYVTHELTHASYMEIARTFSDWDHSTIKYAIKRVRREPLPQYKAQVAAVLQQVQTALGLNPLVPAGEPLLPQSMKKLREEKQ